MSDTETQEKPTEAEEAVKGGLFAALGGFEDTSTPEPKQEEAPVKPEEPANAPAETPAIASKGEVDTSGSIAAEEPAEPSVKLSAKDLRVKKRTQEKAITPTEQPKLPEEVEEKPKEEPAKPDYSNFAKRERDTLELLQFGEGKELADKGTAEQVAKFYEDRAKIIEKLQGENYDDDDYNPQDDPEYRRWANKNKPPVDVDKLEAIRKEQWIDDAKQRALTELRSERAEQDKAFQKYVEDQEREKLRPEVEREVTSFSDKLLADLDPAVTKAYANKKDWEKVEEDMPIEAPIVRQVLNEYTDKAEVLVSIASGITKIDPRNPTHASLKQFISSQAEYFAKQGAEKTTRGGKAFAHPRDFRDPETQWTFAKDDMVKMLSKAAKIVAEKRIATEKNKFQAMLKSQGLSAQQASDVTEEESTGTSVKPSAAGGSTAGAKKRTRSLMDILG